MDREPVGEGGRTGFSVGRGQSSAMASLPHNATLPRYVPKVETHDPPHRMYPQDVRSGSNDARSGAKSYYESIDVEEHGHELVSITVPECKTRK